MSKNQLIEKMVDFIRQENQELRAELKDERDAAIMLRAQAEDRADRIVGKLLPLVPFVLSRFLGKTTEGTGAAVLLVLTEFGRSLTAEQLTMLRGHFVALQGRFSVDQQVMLAELLRAVEQFREQSSSAAETKTAAPDEPDAAGTDRADEASDRANGAGEAVDGSAAARQQADQPSA
jgi:hypothetical protein